jgi:hypothetical protein
VVGSWVWKVSHLIKKHFKTVLQNNIHCGNSLQSQLPTTYYRPASRVFPHKFRTRHFLTSHGSHADLTSRGSRADLTRISLDISTDSRRDILHPSGFIWRIRGDPFESRHVAAMKPREIDRTPGGGYTVNLGFGQKN